MRTDNTMVKRVIKRRKYNENRQYNGQKKKSKGLTLIYKTIHRRLTMEHHQSHIKPRWGELRCSGSTSSSCSTNGNRHLQNDIT